MDALWVTIKKLIDPSLPREDQSVIRLMIIVWAANQSAMEFIEGQLPNRIYFIWQPTGQSRELVEGAAAQ